jgi:transposase
LRGVPFRRSPIDSWKRQRATAARFRLAGLLKRPHWHLHFTPTSASWLNLVEGWFALLTRRRLQRGVFTSTADLEAAIQTTIDQNNAEPKLFVWTTPADNILASVGRFCQRTSNSDHWGLFSLI